LFVCFVFCCVCVVTGNIDTADFVIFRESISGLITVTIYSVLVVIVML
jgi:hypothetical protein